MARNGRGYVEQSNYEDDEDNNQAMFDEMVREEMQKLEADLRQRVDENDDDSYLDNRAEKGKIRSLQGNDDDDYVFAIGSNERTKSQKRAQQAEYARQLGMDSSKIANPSNGLPPRREIPQQSEPDLFSNLGQRDPRNASNAGGRRNSGAYGNQSANYSQSKQQDEYDSSSIGKIGNKDVNDKAKKRVQQQEYARYLDEQKSNDITRKEEKIQHDNSDFNTGYNIGNSNNNQRNGRSFQYEDQKPRSSLVEKNQEKQRQASLQLYDESCLPQEPSRAGVSARDYRKAGQQEYARQVQEASMPSPTVSRSEAYARQLEALGGSSPSIGRQQQQQPAPNSRQQSFNSANNIYGDRVGESDYSRQQNKREQQENYRRQLQDQQNANPPKNGAGALNKIPVANLDSLRNVIAYNDDSLAGLLHGSTPRQQANIRSVPRESPRDAPTTGLMIGGMDRGDERARKKEQQQRYAADIARSAAAPPLESNRIGLSNRSNAVTDYKTRGVSSGGGASNFRIA